MQQRKYYLLWLPHWPSCTVTISLGMARSGGVKTRGVMRHARALSRIHQDSQISTLQCFHRNRTCSTTTTVRVVYNYIVPKSPKVHVYYRCPNGINVSISKGTGRGTQFVWGIHTCKVTLAPLPIDTSVSRRSKRPFLPALLNYRYEYQAKHCLPQPATTAK